jgi:chlorobactene glucosyltransferase
MLFKRTAYEQIGGHAAVRGKVVEDIALGRAVKSMGLRRLFCDLGTRVQCRMYHNWREVWDGFGKNIFPLFNYNLPAFAFAWLWLALVYSWPPLEVLLGLAGLGTQPLLLSVSAVGLGVLLWLLAALRLKLHPLVCIFYPLTSLFFVLVGIRSAFSYYAGKPPSWKGRPLPVSLNAADGKANPE